MSMNIYFGPLFGYHHELSLNTILWGAKPTLFALFIMYFGLFWINLFHNFRIRGAVIADWKLFSIPLMTTWKTVGFAILILSVHTWTLLKKKKYVTLMS